jgi:MFS family permease
LPGYIRLLRENKDFSRLWLAQVVSLLGDWFNTVALSALVSEYSNGSGLAISGLLIARFLPPLIVSPFAGVLIDRFDRKRLLITSDVMRAAIVLLLLFASGREHLWLIYLITVFQFILSAVFEPGRSAIMPSLVTGNDLLRANTLSNVTWSAMLAVGAIVGGVVAAVFGTAIALVIDSLSFALSAFLISQIRTPQPSQTPTHEKTSGSETLARRGGFREGLRYVIRHPPVAAILFIKLGLSIGSVDSLMIAYATHLFVIGENGTGSLGILYSAFGLGAVIGPFILNRFNNGSARTMQRLMIVSFAWVTLGWLLFGLAPSLLVASLALMVRAMGGSATWTYSSTILQISVPNEFLGRVFSLDWAGFYLAITISTLVSGVLIDSLGSEQIRNITIGTGLLSLIPLVLWAATVSWLEKHHTAAIPVGD